MSEYEFYARHMAAQLKYTRTLDQVRRAEHRRAEAWNEWQAILTEWHAFRAAQVAQAQQEGLGVSDTSEAV